MLKGIFKELESRKESVGCNGDKKNKNKND